MLLLTSGNSAAAQLAAGLLHGLGGERFTTFTAATEGTGGDPRAARVLAELGLSAEEWAPRPPEHYIGEPLDYLITVCATGCET